MAPLMLAVALAWIQALTWSPFPLPGLRLLIAGPLVGLALVGTQLLGMYHVSLVPAALAVQLPLAYLIAVVGVSRARRGDVPYWQWPAWPRWPTWTTTRHALPAFSSPARALAWFEWRRWGLTLPLLTAGQLLILLLALPRLAEFLDMAAQAGLNIVPPWLLHELGARGVILLAVVLMPPFLASACGYELGRLPGRDRGRNLSSFLATRPVSAGTIVGAKWAAAARSTVAAWGIVVVGLLLWLALSGHAGELTARWQALRLRHGEGPVWVGVALLLAGSVALTWVQLVQALWTGLAPRRWGLTVGAIGFAGLVGLAVLAQWLSRSAERWQDFAVWLPWLAAAVVALKAAAAAWALRRVVLRRLLPARAVAAGLGAWLAVAVVVGAATYGLSPDQGRSLAGVVLGVALVLPLTRLALALLALDRARHH